MIPCCLASTYGPMLSAYWDLIKFVEDINFFPFTALKFFLTRRIWLFYKGHGPLRQLLTKTIVHILADTERKKIVNEVICISLESGYYENFPHGDLEWTNQGPSRHRGQPTINVGSLPCILIDHNRSTHALCGGNRGGNPHMIPIHKFNMSVLLKIKKCKDYLVNCLILLIGIKTVTSVIYGLSNFKIYDIYAATRFHGEGILNEGPIISCNWIPKKLRTCILESC